jgi:hypothetical protein
MQPATTLDARRSGHDASHMGRPHLPRSRRRRIALVIVSALALYLLALSVVPALLGTRDDTTGRRERGRRAIHAANWGLVPPDDRTALSRAVDDAWRSLATYRMRYVTGLPDDLAAGRQESEAESTFRLVSGRIAAQHDMSRISADSPASGGREERLEGFRIRSNRPYVNTRGRQVAVAELIYQRAVPGQWTCERVAADRNPPQPPALDLADAGDAGFSEIDGRRVRAFAVPLGAFGLRTAATVWIDLDSLRIRRQEIESVLKGRREVWMYGAFDEPVEITPPEGVQCQES